MMVNSHEVEPKLRQPVRLELDFTRLRSEQGASGQIRSPEPRERAIGEYQFIAACSKKAMLSRRNFRGVE
jgi:hypothetical protein